MTVATQRLINLQGDVYVDKLAPIKSAINKSRNLRLRDNLNRQTLRKVKNSFPSARPVLTKRPLAQQAAVQHDDKKNGLEARKDKIKRIKSELIHAGITTYGLMKPESRHLHKILHDNEHIEAIVYGMHHSNLVMLVATDNRIIYFDKKPMATFIDEVSYEVISGLQFDIHLLTATLVLHTPVKNYDIKFANLRCALKFAQHIEGERLKKEEMEQERKLEREEVIQALTTGSGQLNLPQKKDRISPEDLSGYVLLPTDELEREELSKFQT